jgi:hypothetical protein
VEGTSDIEASSGSYDMARAQNPVLGHPDMLSQSTYSGIIPIVPSHVSTN